MRALIVTGDDFGLAVPVNEAVEAAHQRGILTTASLMVGAPAAADAVSRAQRLPTLRVGLHVVVVDGQPLLPPADVAGLVDERGALLSDLVRAGFRFFFSPRARRHLEREIRAQFEAFRRTGLHLDHVNAHNHMHLHPTVLSVILRVGRDYGLRAMRVPHEAVAVVRQVSARSIGQRLTSWFLLSPWVKLVRHRIKRARLHSNDHLLGLTDSGRMDAEKVLQYLRVLPEGVTELYFHPATHRTPELMQTMPDYQHEREFRALVDPRVLEAVRAGGLRRIAFSDL